MKRHMASRIFALLLALVMLASATALAEADLSEEGSVGGVDEVIIEDAGLELADDLADVDLESALVDLELSDGLSDGLGDAPSDQEEALVAENDSEEALLLGVGEKYTLDAKKIGAGKKVTFKSSKKSVATVSSKGVVKGVKKGSANIICSVAGGQEVVYEVQVVAAPRKVKLDRTSVKLGVKESITLKATIPDGTHTSFTWSSSNKKIATVNKAGKVTGKKAGKATITVRTHNGKTARATVTVRKAPTKVTLNHTSAVLKVGGTLQLKATLPSKTYSGITWSSSDEAVAVVNGNGKVTAVAEGVATITATTFNNKQASCAVTVSADVPSTTEYRALLIGQVKFYGMSTCKRNEADVLMMTKMLASVKGLYGGSFSVTQKYNLSANGTLNAIQSAFAGADDDDVSLFFIATHGDVSFSGDRAGELAMSPEGELMLKDLAKALKAVPGKVIVILESCGSGAAVLANGSKGNSRKEEKKALFEAFKERTEAFDAAVVHAFANADSGVEVFVQPNGLTSNGIRSNTGEFRVENKFYVLTASRYQEESWGQEAGNVENSYNFFTWWLTHGIGTSGAMAADRNRNGQTTLNELYSYISDVGDDYPIRDSYGDVYYQHVQVYPANSGFVLFCREY